MATLMSLTRLKWSLPMLSSRTILEKEWPLRRKSSQKKKRLMILEIVEKPIKIIVQ